MRIFKVTLVIVVALLSNFINASPASFLRLEHRTLDEDAPSLPLDNADISEVTSITPVNEKDTYDQRQNGTENYRIHVKGLVVLVAPIESLLLAGGNLGGANDLLSAMGESPMVKPKPKPDELKPIVPVVENATDTAKPEEPEKKFAQRPHLRFASLIAPLLKRVAIH
ncbi:hypothetical protein PV327_007798 [Microctonus hyperodae]|uniref:Uncharacterized protein n=1 Tax=Microctonus hyperodae TaxID=165561 RepID=A0AA39KZ36_MICHY|nr:hypothetical protein PV327_007798 [Microctonus hyperodae]